MTTESSSTIPDGASPQPAILPDFDAALGFLRLIQPGGPWSPSAIENDPPTGQTAQVPTATFQSGEEAGLRAWLQRYHDRGWNLYYHLNPTRAPLSKRASKLDVAAVRFLHVDLDPRAGEDLGRERDRIHRSLTTDLPPGIPPPTFIIDSGGGMQALWRLRELIKLAPDAATEAEKRSAAEEAERYTRELEQVFGADNCHNCDRVLRLPGTVNNPNAKKRAKGRISALAKLLPSSSTPTYDLTTFKQAKPKAAAAQKHTASVNVASAKRFADVNAIHPKLDGKARVVINYGYNPDDRTEFAKPGSTELDRSRALFFACCAMVRAGCDDQAIYSVITDPAFMISASVLDKGSAAERYALKQIQDARADVASKVEDSEEFTVTDSGNIQPTQRNIKLALRKVGVELAYDLFRNRTMIDGLEGFGPELSDMAVNRLWLCIDRRFGFRASFEFFEKVITDAAWEARFNPVVDYLASLKWDGKERVPTWLIEYAGAEDTSFNRAVGRLVLVAAVRRARQPGAKFDEMLVLESPQGMFKSTALRNLLPAPDLFTDSLSLSANVKEQMEQLDGKWIVEAGELQGMRKAEVEKCKGFLSRREDEARLAYGRRASRQPRQCIIVGTTNDKKYLQDLTGNRRFWPVQVGVFRADDVLRDRDQLWAEAAHLEAAGELIRLDESLWAAAAEQQGARLATGPFYEILQPVLDGKSGKVSAESVWRLVGLSDKARRTSAAQSLVGGVMRYLGWEYTNLRFRGEKAWGYRKEVEGEVFVELEVNHDGTGLQVPGAEHADPPTPF